MNFSMGNKSPDLPDKVRQTASLAYALVAPNTPRTVVH